jgi:tRNA threonylcarbamoyladenosine biosynthesis protein TsaB
MELSIDTAGEIASIALSERGALVAEQSWQCRANHSVEVLPAIDQMLERAHVQRGSLAVVFVCRGPGSYGGLRAGLSLAMALANGLGVPILGVGRLEVEAYQQSVNPGPICPVHRAGRGELAWAAYAHREGELVEIAPPQLCWPEELAVRAPDGALFCGELDEELQGLLRRNNPCVLIAGRNASVRRAGAMAELGWKRYAAGERSQAGFVEPLYLREPHITISQKTPRPSGSSPL